MNYKLYKTKNTFVTMVALIIAIALIACIGWIVHVTEFTPDKEDYIELTDGWTVTINDTVYEDVDLDTFTFDVVKKGDVIVLTRVMDCSIDMSPILWIYSDYTTLDVTVDDVNIYCYGQSRAAKDLSVGYGYHAVDLTNVDYLNKTLEISMEVTEDRVFSNLYAPVFMDGKLISWSLLYGHRVECLVDVFLIVFGVVLSIIILVFFANAPLVGRLLFLSMFSALMGVWSICNTDIIWFFSGGYLVHYYAEYISLFFAPVCFMGYFFSEFREWHKIQKILYLSLLIGLITFDVTAVILQLCNVVHMTALLWIFHTFLIVYFLFLLFAMIQGVRKRHHMAMLISMIFVLGVGGFDLIKFYMVKYLPWLIFSKYHSSVPLAILVLVLGMLLDYSREIYIQYTKAIRVEAYERMAYEDFLTGLSTRRKTDELLDEIDENGPENACAISIDLNNLKQVNDTFGHSKGDTLIRDFAQILKEVFGRIGDVGRMGGDEFNVIISDVRGIDLSEYITRLQMACEAYNSHQSDIEMSFAYGICYGNEENMENIRAVYHTADDRMYDNKQTMKAALKGETDKDE